jgi:hypothetical protein
MYSNELENNAATALRPFSMRDVISLGWIFSPGKDVHRLAPSPLEMVLDVAKLRLRPIRIVTPSRSNGLDMRCSARCTHPQAPDQAVRPAADNTKISDESTIAAHVAFVVVLVAALPYRSTGPSSLGMVTITSPSIS